MCDVETAYQIDRDSSLRYPPRETHVEAPVTPGSREPRRTSIFYLTLVHTRRSVSPVHKIRATTGLKAPRN